MKETVWMFKFVSTADNNNQLLGFSPGTNCGNAVITVTHIVTPSTQRQSVANY